MKNMKAWFSRKWMDYRENFDWVRSLLEIALVTVGWFTFFVNWFWLLLLLYFLMEFLNIKNSEKKPVWRSIQFHKIYRRSLPFIFLLMAKLGYCIFHRIIISIKFDLCFSLMLIAAYIYLDIIDDKLKKNWEKEAPKIEKFNYTSNP
jgi:hypothetical protein